MTKPEDMERYLIGQIEEIRRRAEADIKPYMDQLIELRNTRAPALILTPEEVDAIINNRPVLNLDEIGKRKLIP